METYHLYVAEATMGELLLCNEAIAAMPYYMEGVSVNIYSIEELCYYILQNTYLIEHDFMNEELCTWLEKEQNCVKLSMRLRELMNTNGKLSEFVLEILKECAYCTQTEMNDICTVICEMEDKSDFECSKIRADRLMEKEKYLSSIYEYRRLLDLEEIGEEDAVVVGNIWHNLGTAYARMFLFEEAIECYSNAYKKNQNEESLKEQLFAYRCLHDEGGFIRVAREHQMDESAIQAIRSELSTVSRNEETLAFEEQLEVITRLLDSGNRVQYQNAINEIILMWKDNYRRICRV